MILSGWKEIAQYLHCGVRTVQRWEAEGLPVHRPSPHRRSHVIAHSDELERWVRTGSVAGCEYPKLNASTMRAKTLHAEAQPGPRNYMRESSDCGMRSPRYMLAGSATVSQAPCQCLKCRSAKLPPPAFLNA